MSEDPHGFTKWQEPASHKLHAHGAAQSEFPKTVYKGSETKVVKHEVDLTTAIKHGWSEVAPAAE